MTPYLVVVPIGSLLILSALAKFLDPIYFIQHVNELRIVRESLLLPASVAVVCLQGFVGMMLALGQSIELAVPLAIGTLLLFLILTLRGYAVSRIEDCGCYGGLINLSVRQSIIVDLVFILALIKARFSWFPTNRELSSLFWQVLLAGTVGIILGASFLFSYRYYMKHDRLLLNFSPLRVGKPWKKAWLEGKADFSEAKGEDLVVFLRASCSSCKPWIKILNAIHHRPDLPNVTVVLGISNRDEESQGEVAELKAQLPVIVMGGRKLTGLVRSPFPMVLLLNDGVMQGKWTRKMPESVVASLKSGMPKQSEKPTNLMMQEMSVA
ncbi:MAG TPA: MauE/DoxX family redox-associated membrane protein [Thermoanaerobaculia bacterium]|jgi:hypothetical protein|nr:MauE/DoxX family redox-associated membrane protein [Thermoanaerobaculia bacterium]